MATNVSIMDPTKLAAMLDGDTDRLFGGHRRKRNPVPRLRMREGSEPGLKRQSTVNLGDLPNRREIEPLYIYIAEITSGKEDDAAARVATSCSQVRLLTPQVGGQPAFPGYLVLAFDHAMTNSEQAAIGGLCRLLPEVLSEDERQRILALTESERKAI